MLELTVLQGPEAGQRFPAGSGVTPVGRASGMGVRIKGPGVWDHHFDLVPSADGRFELQAAPGARVVIDEQVVEKAPLRDGTVIGCGGVRIRFGLQPVVQRPLAIRERLVWLALGVVLAAELAVLAWVGR
jgi:hypothetical protein